MSIFSKSVLFCGIFENFGRKTACIKANHSYVQLSMMNLQEHFKNQASLRSFLGAFREGLNHTLYA